jgi:hypothetical protein
MDPEYCYLCFNCGGIAPYTDWTFWEYDDDGLFLVPFAPGGSDPIERCPHCKWNHIDDDGNPGIQDGTREELLHERERWARDAFYEWGPDWSDVMEEVSAS